MNNSIKKLQELSRHLVDPEIAVLMFEAIPDGIFMVDRKGYIQYVNKQAEILFGYPRAELFDKNVNTLLPEALREPHTGHIADYVLNPQTRPMGLGRKLMALHKEGDQFRVEISLGPIVAPQGVFTLAVVRSPKLGAANG